jgi:hypothetical protein
MYDHLPITRSSGLDSFMMNEVRWGSTKLRAVHRALGFVTDGPLMLRDLFAAYDWAKAAVAAEAAATVPAHRTFHRDSRCVCCN